MPKQLLIIFIKNAEKGKVKTRLAQTLGDDKALEVYQALLKKTKEAALGVKSADKIVYYSGHQESDDIWTESIFQKAVQYNGTLSERMIDAFQRGFEEGYENICIIGSDCWDLDNAKLQEAFDGFEKHDFVIGPANDGGYYLLGLSYFLKSLFEGKEFSTETVYQEAIEEISRAGKSVLELDELIDIDTEEDLKRTSLRSLL